MLNSYDIVTIAVFGLYAIIVAYTWITNYNKQFLVGRMQFPQQQLHSLLIVFSLALFLLLFWVLSLVHIILWGAGVFGWGIEQSWMNILGVSTFVIFVFFVIYARYIEPKTLKVRYLDIPGITDKDKDKDKDKDPKTKTKAKGFRLVVLSDLHVDGARPPYSLITEKVNHCKPDCVLLLGDLLQNEESLPILQSILAGIECQVKYAVKGNWETWYWDHLDFPLLENTGFRWLDGLEPIRLSSISMEDGDGDGEMEASASVVLCGQDFHDREDGIDAADIVRKIQQDSGSKVIFAYHTPDLVEKVCADLYLCGHTHGGQIWVPFYGSLVTLSNFGKKYERGLRRVTLTRDDDSNANGANSVLKSKWIYTSAGIGVEPIVPFRLFCPPEIVVIDIAHSS